MHLEDSGRSACVRTEGSVLEGTGKLKYSSCPPWDVNGYCSRLSVCIRTGEPTDHHHWQRNFMDSKEEVVNNEPINKLTGRWDHSLQALHCHGVQLFWWRQGFGCAWMCRHGDLQSSLPTFLLPKKLLVGGWLPWLLAVMAGTCWQGHPLNFTPGNSPYPRISGGLSCPRDVAQLTNLPGWSSSRCHPCLPDLGLIWMSEG